MKHILEKIRQLTRTQKILVLAVLCILVGAVLARSYLENQPSPPLPPAQPQRAYRSVRFTSIPPKVPRTLAVYQAQTQVPDIITVAESIARELQLSQHQVLSTLWISEDQEVSVFADLELNHVQYIPAPTTGPLDSSDPTANREQYTRLAQEAAQALGLENRTALPERITFYGHEGMTSNPAEIEQVAIPLTIKIDDIPIQSTQSNNELVEVFLKIDGSVAKIELTPSAESYELLQTYPSYTFNQALSAVERGNVTITTETFEQFPSAELPGASDQDLILERATLSYRIDGSQVIPHYTFFGYSEVAGARYSSLSLIVPAVALE